jgi:hypothetical protein
MYELFVIYSSLSSVNREMAPLHFPDLAYVTECQIPMPMSRQDIADYLGLTIETACRMLTKLRGSSIIEFMTAIRSLFVTWRPSNALRSPGSSQFVPNGVTAVSGARLPARIENIGKHDRIERCQRTRSSVSLSQGRRLPRISNDLSSADVQMQAHPCQSRLIHVKEVERWSLYTCSTIDLRQNGRKVFRYV